MIENLTLIRNILYRGFFIGFALVIFTSLVYVIFQDWAVSFGTSLFPLSKNEMIAMMLYFVGWMKIIAGYFFLIPALAIHWTINSMKKDKK